MEGKLPLLEALDAVLAGSGLQYRVISQRAVAIIAKPKQPEEAAVASSGNPKPLEESYHTGCAGHRIAVAPQ